MEVKEKMYEIVSNYNPLSNLDTSSPKVNHNHVSYTWVLVFQSWFGYWAVDSISHLLKDLSPCVKACEWS